MRVCIDEGELQRNSVGIEERAGLKKDEENGCYGYILAGSK